MKKILGIDVGGVIMKNATEDKDTSFFSDNYLKTEAQDDAIEVINELVTMFDETYIVSKCGKKIQDKTLNWFKYHNFYSKAGINPKNVYFCVERHEKNPICKKLGITHFIDDKLEVLSYLETVKNRYLFKPKEQEMNRYCQYLSQVKVINSWRELLAIMKRKYT